MFETGPKAHQRCHTKYRESQRLHGRAWHAELGLDKYGAPDLETFALNQPRRLARRRAHCRHRLTETCPLCELGFGRSQPAHSSVLRRLSDWPRAACSRANEKKGRVASALHSHMHSSYLLAADAAGVAASCILLGIAVLPCLMVPIGIEAESAGWVAAE